MKRCLWAMLVLTSACVTAAPVKSPGEGGAPWTELTSPHFVLRTDLDQEKARAVLAQIEAIDDALEQVAFPPSSKTPNRILVVDFATQAEFEAYEPLNSS